MACGIYSITHQTGLRYVGQSQCIERRWQSHLSLARGKRRHYKLYRAMRRLGVETFSFEIVEECPVENLDERELHWMVALNALDPVVGLNVGMEPGASMRGRKHSDEARALMSAAQRGEKNPRYGKKFSDETRDRISAALRGEKHPNYGKKFSDERRAKMSEACRGEKHPNYGKIPSDETRAKRSESMRKYWAERRAADGGDP